jgi:PAS domain S-box-containing protein
VNDVICTLTGYTREELLNLHYRDITYPDDIDIDIPFIQQLLKKEISSYAIEKRYVAKNRRVLTTMINVSLVWNKDNTPKYFVCDIQDITHMKETEEELKRRNQELETTSANLIGKMKQLEELNQIIAHNLRGPAGNIKILSDDAGFFSPAEAIKMIHTSSLTLLSNLDMLVEAARIKLDKQIAYEKCAFQGIIDDIIGQLQGTIYQNNVSIETDLAVPEIDYPRIYLESILYNLISNAIKYRRTDIQPLIRIASAMQDGKVQLSVKDNGLGIDLDSFANKVFKLNQVFHPGHDSKGVGLFITKTQIESLGGTIDVKSKPNEGCEFTVVLG